MKTEALGLTGDLGAEQKIKSKLITSTGRPDILPVLGKPLKRKFQKQRLDLGQTPIMGIQQVEPSSR